MNKVNVRGAYAGFVTRAAALILDLVFIAISIGVVNWLFGALLVLVGIHVNNCGASAGWYFTREGVCRIADWMLLIFSSAFPFLYLIFFWVLGGQTPGKYIMGLRVVSWDGKRVTLIRALRRLFGYMVSILTFGYGFLRVLFDENRRGTHDKIAGTYVIFVKDTQLNVHLLERVNGQVDEVRTKAKQLRQGKHQLQLAASSTTADSTAVIDLPGQPEPGEAGEEKPAG